MKFQFVIIQVLLAVAGIYSLEINRYEPVLSYINFDKLLVDSVTYGSPVSSSVFSSDIQKLIRDKVNLIVVKDLLSQDVSQLLRKSMIKNSHFEPLVERPLKTLEDYLQQNKNIKVNKIELSDVQSALDKFSQIQEQNESVFLTSAGASVERRVRRQAEANSPATLQSNATTTYIYGTQCAAYFDTIYSYDKSASNPSSVDLPIGSGNTFTCDGETAELKINFNKNSGYDKISIDAISLFFTSTNRFWSLSNATAQLENGQMSLIYMDAPYGMETPVLYSYVCTRSGFLLYNSPKDAKKIWLYIENFQFQPFNVTTNSSSYTFGRVNYCQGFFSSGIWMAISASLILTFILAFGITFLFNINTMDRFDDPKGKQLSIAAEK